MKKLKKIISCLLMLATLFAACSIFAGCSYSLTEGVYLSEQKNEAGEVEYYVVEECPKSTLKKDKIEIPSSYEGKPVRKISSGAFKGGQMTEVVLPEGITVIHGGFEDCPNLTTVNIPDSVIEIDCDVFKGSPKVGVVENGFRYVDGWIVAREESEYYTLRSDTRGVADYVSLAGIEDAEGNVVLPDSIKHLGAAAFRGLSLAGDVTLPANLINMAAVVFSECTIGGTLTLPRALSYIDGGCFYKATISKLVIECEALHFENDSDMMFSQCRIGELVMRGGSITYYRAYEAFSRAKVITMLVPANKLTYFNVSPETLIITEGAIPAHAYRQIGAKHIVMEAGVTEIGEGAFSGCSNIESLTVKNESLTVGAQVFYQTSLKRVSAPAAVVAAMPTASCTEVTVSAGQITADTLKNATGITTLNVGDAVTAVAEGAFDACTAVKKATVPAKYLSYLPKGALTHVTVSSGTEIAENALAGATALTEVTLPTTLSLVGAAAFADATALKTVRYMGSAADWARINFADAIANPLQHNALLLVKGEAVTAVTGLAEIGSYAFAGYAALTSITFATERGVIGAGAFANCTGLTALTLPTTLCEIGSGAFRGCTALAAVTFENTSGWVRYEGTADTMGNAVQEYYLSDPARAAAYLTDTYTAFIWKYIA